MATAAYMGRTDQPRLRLQVTEEDRGWQQERTAYASSRSPVAVCITIAIHLVIAALLLVSWRPVTRLVLPSSAPLVVELQPLAAPASVRDVAPGPEQVEHSQEAPQPPTESLPIPIIQISSERPTAVQPPAMVTPIDPGPAVPETTAPKSIAAPPAPRLSSLTRPNWEALVLAHLERYRIYPARAKAARQQGTVQVRFTLNRKGEVLALSIAKASPFFGLDQAAVDTVRRAQPLPPVPETFPDPIELAIPVEFYLR
ncbi:MAG: energy transducer TonB [Sphingobium sp.]